MSRHKKKTCIYCYAPLSGRRDAKTCSARCRKRLQRARLLLEHDLKFRVRQAHTVGLEISRTEVSEPAVAAGRNGS